MSAFENQNRAISGQSWPAIDRRAPRARHAYSASLVAQILVGHERQRCEPVTILPPRNSASEAYRGSIQNTLRRMPAGFAHAEVA
jgi:hypothetical protein